MASYHVYELEQGWGFDGGYIPHFIELNWYFGDNPVTYHTVQKLRVHGLAKGRASLQVSMAGMQTEYDSDYTTPQYIDLPAAPSFINPEFVPVSNYTDTANRGISIQMKFEGRVTDIQTPEPPHVLQVLVVQSSPDGSGARAN